MIGLNDSSTVRRSPVFVVQEVVKEMKSTNSLNLKINSNHYASWMVHLVEPG
ncbi:unnamed protein product [Arabidopsis halleri]